MSPYLNSERGPPPLRNLDIDQFSNVITFYLNGEKRVLNDPNPEGTLLDYIRETGLTGTKLGCSEGGCGACTVVIASWDPISRKERHLAVNSCIVPLISVDSKHLITVEGIGSTNDPHPAQERIALFHGSQCGFCTPGIVMSLYALLRSTNGEPTQEQVAESFDGNLCRCTGYKPIIDAASTFTNGGCCGKTDSNGGTCCMQKNQKEPTEACCKDKSFGNGLVSSNEEKEVDFNLVTPNGLPLRPYKADKQLIFPPALKKNIMRPLYLGNDRKVWFRPVTKLQLLQIKQAYPNAKLVGGASEIQIEIKMKAMDYNVSVYANDIEELKSFSYIPGKGIEFGANIALSDLEHHLSEIVEKIGKRKSQIYAAMLEQLKYFAGRQIRNVATPAGNIATASPISDLNPVLVAAGATIAVESLANGTELLNMNDFFLGYRKTRLPSHGVITKVFVPETQESNEVVTAYKQSKRKDDDIAIVTSSMRMILDDHNTIKELILVYGGVAPITMVAKKTAALLEGRLFNESTLKSLIELGSDSLMKEDFDLPYSVPGGMASYRRSLVLSFFYKFINHAAYYFNISGGDYDALQEVSRTVNITGSRDLENPFEERILGKSDPHLSALKQVSGEASYLDDIPPYHREVFGVQVMSTRAHAKILSVDTSAALAMEGVIGYVDVNDVHDKESNYWGILPVGKEAFFADGIVEFVGQCIGLILAVNRDLAAEAVRAVKVEYEDLDPILTIEKAIEKNSYFILPQPVLTEKGDPSDSFEKSDFIFEGECHMGGQEHFYLEPQGSLVVPEEDGELKIYSSSQNPSETQEYAAHITGVPNSKVVCRVKRLGGGFGGKETRCVPLSSIAAVAAKKYMRPVRVVLSRSEDMLTSGIRHPFYTKWKVGLDKNYRFTALNAELYANCGWSLDLSKGVIERAVLHMDNCYNFPNARVEGFLCKTNLASNTAFRGFGGPQGMFAAECIIYEVAEKLGIEPDVLRERNYYIPNQHSTHYKQAITEDFTVPELVRQVKEEANYEALRNEVDEFNANHKWIKRGLAHVPTKFGVSFGALFLNQAGALVHIYKDGSILLSHGGTEMGQGLHTKMAMVCASELKVPLKQVFISETSTNTVPNTSASAASASSDLNGMAVKNACEQLNERLQPYREKLGTQASMAELAKAAYFDRVNLSANGFYKTPEIGYVWGDPNPKPAFFYFTQGSAVSLVEVNTLTGDWSGIRTDIKMDIGRPINQAIDYGQIEGAFIQGQGLFTIEECLWMNNGSVFTRGPGAYKIPGFRDVPQNFNVGMLKNKEFKHLKTINRSKGIGEPPLFLGCSVFFAIQDALKSARCQNGLGNEPIIGFRSPMTTEQIRILAGDEILDKAYIGGIGEKGSFYLYTS